MKYTDIQSMRKQARQQKNIWFLTKLAQQKPIDITKSLGPSTNLPSAEKGRQQALQNGMMSLLAGKSSQSSTGGSTFNSIDDYEKAFHALPAPYNGAAKNNDMSKPDFTVGGSWDITRAVQPKSTINAAETQPQQDINDILPKAPEPQQQQDINDILPKAPVTEQESAVPAKPQNPTLQQQQQDQDDWYTRQNQQFSGTK